MTRHLRWFILVVLTSVAPASAQYYLDIYPSATVSGDDVVGTGVIQFNPGQNCTMCQTAYHTYQETEKIISPSGRTASCTFDQGYPASYSFSQQCQASLAVGTDYGNYTAEDSPDVTCSQIGNVVNTNINILIHWGITYTATTGWPCNGPLCYQRSACNPGTVASCPMLAYVNSGGPCYEYVVTFYLVASGQCYGITGKNSQFIVPADGPGNCQ